jgi:3-oxo-4,17-pregnadiene-20-carboxyl-CoA hydratase alpha subunit
VSVTASETLMDRLRSFVGRASGEPLVGRDPVNEAQIRQWCDAIDDRNPVYTDEVAAAASVHGGLVAPPTMLQAWTMQGLRPERTLGPGAPMPQLLEALDQAGFPAIVATNCEQEYVRYLRPGDRIAATTVIEAVTEEKRTALGPGHFVTTVITYTDEKGEAVGTQRFRLLVYRPVEAAAPAQRTAKRPRPATSRDTEFFWEGAARGELLIQRCSSCGTLRHPPRPACGSCRSFEWDALRASGRGEVYSHVTMHHPVVPPFEAPYDVALVQLEEGVRLVSNVVGVAPDEVRIGMPVEVVFEKVDDELTLPLFRPRKES